MNALQTFIALNDYDNIKTMNRITEAGIISDNAVMPADVADVDCVRAVAWLRDIDADVLRE